MTLFAKYSAAQLIWSKSQSNLPIRFSLVISTIGNCHAYAKTRMILQLVANYPGFFIETYFFQASFAYFLR